MLSSGLLVAPIVLIRLWATQSNLSKRGEKTFGHRRASITRSLARSRLWSPKVVVQPMDHPSIMKLLEDDEDETMHSGADVEALSAALNRDIGGDSSTFSQLSDSESVGVLPQASSSASQELLGQWQTSNQEGNIDEDVQPKNGQSHSQSSEQLSSPIRSTQQVSGGQDQRSNTQPKDDQPQLQKEHSHSDQLLQSETNAPQTVEKDQVKPSDQIPFQIPKLESSSQHSQKQQQNTNPQMNVEQQATTSNEANLAAKQMKASTSIPFQLLIPIIRPHLDKDRSMQLQSVFTKLRTNEVSKDDFLRVIRNIVGDQMLRQAVNKVHMQLQAQAARNQQPNANQYALQNQISQQQLLSRGANQFPNARAFSSLSSMSSSQNQKSHSPCQPVPASTVQMQMDTSFPSTENSGKKSREIETSSDGRGMHSVQMHPTNKTILNPERDLSMNPLQASNKQQHVPRPQTSFPVYNGSSSNFHSNPYVRPPINAATTSLSQQPQDSQMRHTLHTQGMALTQAGPTQLGNVINAPKYELQNIAIEAKKFHGGPSTNHLASQHHLVPWQPMANKEQRSTSIPSSPYVKQEVVDQFCEPPNKSQLTASDGSSFDSGNIGQGNPTFGSFNNEGIEKQSSRMGVSSTIGSQTNLSDSTLQNSSNFVAGTATKTPSKKPSVGQKKPFEAVANSSAMASKKQKTNGVFHEQSIEHLNDVTAVSGVNLREEEEQLLSAPKEDSRASEATRRVVQEEEERLILQKAPLQKKLVDIILKSGLKKISSDVEHCLSMCVEERLQGIVSSLIRLSKQRVDVEKTRHRFVITSDVHRHILETNKKAKDEWGKKQAEEAEKLRKDNETEVNAGSDADRDKDEGRSKINKANKEEDDKMRATAANVAARAAVGGDDMLSKWQLMAEQARQKREGLDVPSFSQPSKATNSRPSTSFKRNFKAHQETQRRGASLSGVNRKFGRSRMANSQSKVVRSISRMDIIAMLEREPQMSKSLLIYRLYEKSSGDSVVE